MINKNVTVNIKGNKTYECEVTLADSGDVEVNITAEKGWQGRFLNGSVVQRHDKCSYLAYKVAEWIGEQNIETIPNVVNLSDVDGCLA